MKIIKTRKRTEIEITHLELRQMLLGGPSQLAECASNILMIVKKANQYNDKKDDAMFNFFSGTSGKRTPNLTKKTLAECIDLIEAEKLSKIVNKKFEEYGNREAKIGVDLAKEGTKDRSHMICGVGFGPNPFHYEMKSQTEIVENIKKKERGKVIEEVFDILRKNTVDKTGIADDIKKLIRKEQRDDRS